MQWVIKLAQLSWGDRLFLCKTYILLALIRLGLWLLPFERLYKQLDQLSHPLQKTSASNPLSVDLQPNDPQTINRQVVQRVVWAINVSCKLMPGTVKCLARALAAKVLLERRSCPCELKIGVAKSNAAKLEAHAWIEVQGYVVLGQLHDLDRFKPFPKIPQFR